MPISASMEPRSAERGNKSSGTRSFSSLRASMEPRSAERGNACYSVQVCRLRKSLQWSHAQPNVETLAGGTIARTTSLCFNGATLSRTWKLIIEHQGNQWTPSFNGATLSRTWKRKSSVEHTCRRVIASMEPRSAERGNTLRSSRARTLPSCFNGATLSRTWKLDRDKDRGAAIVRFNGATLSRTWKQRAK